jgi:hypothetical protein
MIDLPDTSLKSEENRKTLPAGADVPYEGAVRTGRVIDGGFGESGMAASREAAAGVRTG